MKSVIAFFTIMFLVAVYGLYKTPHVIESWHLCKLLTLMCGIVAILCVAGVLIVIDAKKIERLEEPECTKNPN